MTCSSSSVAVNSRSSPASTAAGRGSVSASARSALRTRPMPAAASRPLPMTSPTVTASRRSGRRNTSYQSPPTSVDLGRYLASSARPATRGSSPGSRLRCRVTAAVCSFSYISARSTASAHWPARASRKTRSSSRIVRGLPKENRSAPSGMPRREQRQADPGLLVAGVHDPRPAEPPGVRVVVELAAELLGIGDEHRAAGRDRARHHARGVQREPHARRRRARSGRARTG